MTESAPLAYHCVLPWATTPQHKTPGSETSCSAACGRFTPLCSQVCSEEPPPRVVLLLASLQSWAQQDGRPPRDAVLKTGSTLYKACRRFCCRHRTSRLAVEAASTLAAASGGGALQFEGPAWNGCTVDMIRLAKAHAYLILQANFVSHIAALKRKVCRMLR